MRNNVGEEAIKKLAKEQNLSLEEVKKEIEIAIDLGMANSDPKISEYWSKMCNNGRKPTPEDVISYLVKEVIQESKSDL